MKHRLTTALGVVTIVSGLLAAAPTPALATSGTTTTTTTTITPSALPHGKAAHDYLVGRTIHPATGPVIRLPRAWKPAQLRLIGHSTKGWLVSRFDYDTAPTPTRTPIRTPMRLYRVTRGAVRLIDTVDVHGVGTGQQWSLTSDGSRIVSHRDYLLDNQCARFALLDLRGHRIAARSTGCSGSREDVLGASRGKVWFRRQGGETRVWDVRTGTITKLGDGVSASLIDRRHDLLFTDPAWSTTDEVGPTSFSSPGTPAWTADFTPIAVSPDGALVVGLSGDQIGVRGEWWHTLPAWADPDIEIRRVSDGTLVHDFHFASHDTDPSVRAEKLPPRDIWWENSSTLLIAKTLPHRTWLIRCTVGGACATAAPSVPWTWGFWHRHVTDWH
ncbi:hypothetical protein [Nocardioides ultimimeridianus]